jgi:VWFA-related protein
MMRKLGWLLILFFLGAFTNLRAQQDGVSSVPAPTRQQKPIFLDVVVSDRAAMPIGSLEPFDFSVFDDNQQRKVLGFRRTDGVAGSKTEPPVEVIIVLDAVNMPYQVATRLRLEVDKFLRANDGQLKQPVSIYMFTSEGLRVQPSPSKDGKGLADMLDKSVGTVRSRDISGGVYSLEEQFTDSYKTVSGIAENLSRKPGRKVVIWLGPGWPLLTERFFIQTDVSRGTYYKQLAGLQNKLREARVTLYCLYSTAGVTNTLYEGYLKPVREVRKMEIGNMALQVLALHTGGRVLGPGNDVKAMIDSCVAEIGEYYTLAIIPPVAAVPDEYHDLKVQVNRPDATVKTVIGYYDEPAAVETDSSH